MAENSEKLCNWLENECDMEVITLDEIYDQMNSSDEFIMNHTLKIGKK